MAFNPREHLMDLKGKEYLQVMWRLVWFREEKPLWSIDTELVEHEEGFALFRASIADENGAVKATAFGSETVKDFRDYIEKAETKAVGRALAMLGYGTQFTATELDEGDRIVDSPVAKPKAKPAAKAKKAVKEEEPPLPPLPEPYEEDAPPEQIPLPFEDGTAVYCAECGHEITPADTSKFRPKGSETWVPLPLEKHIALTRIRFGQPLCRECAEDRQHVNEMKAQKVGR